MVDCSKCKIGSWYWIKNQYFCNGSPSGPPQWIPVKRLKDSWVAVLGPTYTIDGKFFLEIGPEIVPPKDKRKPGIYRVKWLDGECSVSEWTGQSWRVAGYAGHFNDGSFAIIGDYLGPVETPSNN